MHLSLSLYLSPISAPSRDARSSHRHYRNNRQRGPVAVRGKLGLAGWLRDILAHDLDTQARDVSRIKRGVALFAKGEREKQC